MATETYGKPITAIEGEAAAITLSTTADYLAVKPGFHEVMVNCATAWRLSLSPALLHCLYYDGTDYADYKTQATDRVSTTHVPLDGMTTSHALYLGFSEPALGVQIDMGSNVNAATATLDVDYCSTAVPGTLAFTNVEGDSDGTFADPATLGQDGVYTWTLPTAWVRSTLGTSTVPLYSKCWWIRIVPSATLTDPTDINEIIPVYKNTNYGWLAAATDYIFSVPASSVGGFVFKAVAATPALNVTWMKH